MSLSSTTKKRYLPIFLVTILGSTILLGIQTQVAQAAVNSLPTIVPIADQTVDELTTLSFSATGSDPDGQTLTFSMQNAPYGAVINPATGAFSWTPSEEQGPGVYSINVVVSDGMLISSESVLIIVNDVGGGGSGGGKLRTSTSALELGSTGQGSTGLYADPSNIPLDATANLTQLSDPANNGELNSLTVFEPDGDTCAATGLGLSIPTGGISKEYPSDFALMSNGGDGICDTGDVGVYHAQSEMNTTSGTLINTAEFETDSPFVLPESPIGIIALMASSLAVLGAFTILKNRSADKTRTGM